MIRRFVYLRLLRLSLVAGALYDLAFAVLMASFPEPTAQALSLPLPGEPFYLDLLAVLLAMLGALYLLAAREPRRYSAIIVVAILGRPLGAAVLAFAAWGRPDLQSLWALAGADLAFGLAHLATWLPLRR